MRSFLVRLTIITSAPASAKAIAQALPIPLPAPVIKAFLLFKFCFFKNISYYNNSVTLISFE